jgi:hypothetical protein
VKGTSRPPSPVGHLVSFLGVIVIIPFGLFGRMVLEFCRFKHLCSILQWPKGQKHYVHQTNHLPDMAGEFVNQRICSAVGEVPPSLAPSILKV